MADWSPPPVRRRRVGLARLGQRRLSVIAVLVASLLVTLLGRLYYVQELDPNQPVQTANQVHDGSIVIPAPRGLIVDSTGRPLVANTSSFVVSIDREAVITRPDHGVSVLDKVATLLGTTRPALAHLITPCSSTVSAPCWTGEPFAPVPVLTNASTSVVLAISEHQEDYPGVTVTTQSQRDYPNGTLAAHLLGYSGAVTADDIKTDPKLQDADSIGRSGLEEQYDSVLRGVDGVSKVPLDPQGYADGTATVTQPTDGDTLVTSIDAKVQALAEKALADQIAASRAKGKAATAGALVVMDPNTGRIIAAASNPSYDPQLFVGGISNANYAKLTSPSANDPLVGRAISGAYAPGSTFKLITSSSLVTHNEISLDGTYGCPSSVNIDGRTKTNYDSEGFGYPLSLKQALQVSCDTFFYVPEANEYYTDQQSLDNGGKANEYLQRMAASFGIGSAPGVDLPADEQATGSYADRETRLARWKANRTQYCAAAAKGYPDVADTAQRTYLTQLASENCTDGWRYRAGDNADMAIGQGETTLSPLQLAIAYSALVDGGRVWKPTIGRAVLDANGHVIRQITPTVARKVPVAQSTLNYIADSLHFTDDHAVSGALAFDGSPYKTEIGGKTGTAEVEGKGDTSWFASWGPISTDAHGNPHARFVVVGMIEQAGTGASAAAPAVREVYNGLLGVGTPAVLAGSTPATTIPKVTVATVPPTTGSTTGTR